MENGRRKDEETHLVEIDEIELFASHSMEHATLVVEENDLEGLKLLCKLARSNVGIDVEDLTSVGLGKTSENRKGAGTNSCLDGTLVDLGDFADEAVLVLVKVVGGEDARGDRTGTGAKLFKGSDKLEVLVEEDTASNLESLGIWEGAETCSGHEREGKGVKTYR